ncbi:MAG: putative Non-canonical purine pyrophosphatase [Candidatus Saccharibacteria bacterium]|nr:putative Non-canonical purine pyrophosphatase [Candidatus Saccharibacteria bacterium]
MNMPKEIIFATTNSAKVGTLRRHAEQAGLDVIITQMSLDLPEIQANTATEVAKSKALQAHIQLKRAVLVDDSAFHIDALGGFPGPYIKYMLETVGIDGIMSFMEGKSNRDGYFLSSLVFIDSQGEMRVFEDAPYYGTITDKIDDFHSDIAWSALSKIFIPKGSDKVLARMTSEDHAHVDENHANSYVHFVHWLKSDAS